MHKTVNKVVKVASSALHAVVASEGADIVEAVIGDDYTVGTGSGSAWSPWVPYGVGAAAWSVS